MNRQRQELTNLKEGALVHKQSWAHNCIHIQLISCLLGGYLAVLKRIFTQAFYAQFRAKNCEDLTALMQRQYDIDNAAYKWGNAAISDKALIPWASVSRLISPSVSQFQQILNKDFKYKPYDPWINFYQRGFFRKCMIMVPMIVRVYSSTMPMLILESFIFLTDIQTQDPMDGIKF